MAQKDIAQKLLEDYEDVFADIVNVLVFDGEEVVRPDALEASNLRSQYKAASDGMLHGQERDVVKYWKDGDVRIGLIGLENQIKVEREMVLRVLRYDEVAWLDDETISKFTSDFRIVADFFVQRRKNKDHRPSAEKIRHVDEFLKLLAAFTGDTAYENMNPSALKGDVTMCKVVEQFRNEGLEQGRTDEQKRIAENMVIQGCEDTLIISVTGIARERLDAIKSNVQKSE